MHLIQLLKLVIVRIIVTIVIQLVLKVLKIVLILVLEQIKLLKNLELSEIISIFAHRTMDVFHYWDWGVPDRKSCQVRGDSFLCLLGWIDFETQKFAILHEYIGSQYVIGQIDCLWIQNVASQWIGYQVGNLQTSNIF